MPGSFDESLGNISEDPLRTILIAAGAGILIVILAKVFWKQLKKLWAKAKQGGVILSHPKQYFLHSFLPAFLSWLCKLTVIGIFLAAFAIPVTFESIMWVTGSGSLANVVSFTPGAVGITQATNALALDTCCDVARDTAVDYSTAQQLITTAWNVLLALVLVVSVFGWKGGKQLVTQSYADAKVKVAEQKAQHAEKKAEKKAERAKSGDGRFRRRHDEGAAETPSPPRPMEWTTTTRERTMAGENLVLVVGSYPDAEGAAEDFKALRDAEGAGEYEVVGAVVMSRDASGKVEVSEKGGPEVAGGAVLGGTVGLVVGLFAPPLLAATAVGAGIGAVVGRLSRRHEEKELGVELEEYLAPGTSAVVVVVDDLYADRVENALSRADKRVNKAIDSGDDDELQKALAQSSDEVSDAVTP